LTLTGVERYSERSLRYGERSLRYGERSLRLASRLGGPFAVPVIALLAPNAGLSEIRSAGTRPRQRLCWRYYSRNGNACQARDPGTEITWGLVDLTAP